jgi:hypothetical protein
MRIELNSEDMRNAVEHYVRTVLMYPEALLGKTLDTGYMSGTSVYIEQAQVTEQEPPATADDDDMTVGMAPAATD